MIGSPCTARPPPSPPPPAAGAGAAGAASVARSAVRGESAAQQSPGPRTIEKGRPAMPDTYRMSENPGGGATSDRDPAPVLPPCTKAVRVSGSYAEPGQFVTVDAPMAPRIGPL